MLIGTLVTPLGSCSVDDAPPSGASKHTDMEITYPYEMLPGVKFAFFAKIKALRRGETRANVVRLVGPPDTQYNISAKEHNRPLGTRLCYYVKKLDTGVNEKYDQSVSIDFDNDDKLVCLGIQNLYDLEGLTNVPLTGTRWNNLKNEIEVIPEAGKGGSHQSWQRCDK